MSQSKVNPASDAAVAAQTVPSLQPFSAHMMDRQFVIDRVLWSAFAVMLIGLMVYASIHSEEADEDHVAMIVLLLGFIGLWLAYDIPRVRVMRDWPRILELTELAHPEAEPRLASALSRRPLRASMRVQLYHRLAVLRHRQRRLGEAAAVCQALLRRRLGAAGAIKPHLLLMLTEAQVLTKDYWGAWQSLSALSAFNLPPRETLQRLAWQTRYEVETGAFAAAATGRPDKADWLRRRAELLCTSEQLRALTPDGPSPQPA